MVDSPTALCTFSSAISRTATIVVSIVSFGAILAASNTMQFGLSDAGDATRSAQSTPRLDAAIVAQLVQGRNCSTRGRGPGAGVVLVEERIGGRVTAMSPAQARAQIPAAHVRRYCR